ncbi:M15 family metallopeptidase [Vibrio vulnificus]|uniref:M15 family metallopeptidase n=1 Tax=Vibrio TaxID=662 RepID=UPI001594AED8|nr:MULTISPECIES: M15 family metallopeptidase [Vibrio]MCF8780875.1 M15 family metallopeptidase [Vibrio floridensis]NVC62769.1 D-alanyl-D-alanine carboxypeptidase family protein [Vibrio sp. 05-20-BW147]HAS6348696.1 D-alanyl-D-alanine carboxypeptidase family protein [Vibrio vulnificus]
MNTIEQLTGSETSHLEHVLVGEKWFWLHPEVKNDLFALLEAAQTAGFKMEIASGFRDFQRQRAIWNAKFSGTTAILDRNSQPIDKQSLTDEEKMWAILRWSALPGASRHHWGCDFDVFARNLLPENESLKLEPWEYHSGHQAPFYLWLQQHLSQFGFFFPYAEDLGGVAAEPWHISHVATSCDFLQALTLTQLRHQLEQHPIDGQKHVLANLSLIYNQFIANICPAEAV